MKPADIPEWTKYLEPTCWGSDELPLIPETLQRACSDLWIHGYQPKKKGKPPATIRVADLAAPAWSKKVGNFVPKNETSTLLDVVSREIEILYSKSPDLLDVPVLKTKVETFTFASGIPFEIGTWDLLHSSGISSDLDIAVVLTGTFREIMDRLGNGRAALDIAVTGAAWIKPNEYGNCRIQRPTKPITIKEAISIARLRAFRSSGSPVDAKTYTPMMAELIGSRYRIGRAKSATLAECADVLGVTRERFRQIECSVRWSSSSRRWPITAVLSELAELLVTIKTDEALRSSTGEEVSRLSAISLLSCFGFVKEQFMNLGEKLAVLDLNLSVMKAVAYRESEKTGLITVRELKYHLKDQFSGLDEELLEAVVHEIVEISDLPHGYVYLEGQKGSSIKNWLTNLLSTLGPQTFDEALGGLERFFRVRRPGIVFPPRPVLEELLRRDSSFSVYDEKVGLSDSLSRELTGIEKWFEDTIRSCTGQVIHRTELWSRAREAKVKTGTVSVYASYSLYFKPLKGGLVTVTGLDPADIFRDLARTRANAIRVPLRRLKTSINDGYVKIRIQVGNSFLDTGVLSTTVEIRKLLQGKKFDSIVNSDRFGSISWSGDAMIGFGGSMQALGVMPGDIVNLVFHPVRCEMTAEFSVLEID